MKHSIRIKFAAVFISLFATATCLVLLINHLWLPQYYEHDKMETDVYKRQ